MWLVATLCCNQDVTQTIFHHLDPVTELGQLAVQRVAAAVLEATNLDERQLTFALATSTVQNVLTARHLCMAALQASVCLENCFRLFRFADQCGIAPLRQVAERACLASMPRGDAAAQDATGFALLHQEQLQSLLQSDGLQVSSEMDVFRAIAAWVQARPQERASAMAALVQTCVRLGVMDLSQLEQLDADPAVVACGQVTRVVAHAYVMRALCMKPSSGGGADSRPRDSVARAAAAAAGRQDPFAVPVQSMAWAH